MINGLIFKPETVTNANGEPLPEPGARRGCVLVRRVFPRDPADVYWLATAPGCSAVGNNAEEAVATLKARAQACVESLSKTVIAFTPNEKAGA